MKVCEMLGVLSVGSQAWLSQGMSRAGSGSGVTVDGTSGSPGTCSWGHIPACWSNPDNSVTTRLCKCHLYFVGYM